MGERCRAIVTGASRGVGFLAAYGLARAGCSRILLGARGLEGLKEAAKRLADDTGAEVSYSVLDLRDPASVESFVVNAVHGMGGVDAAVLSYGNPSCEPCTLDEAGWDDWLEAFKMYTASTALILRLLARGNPSQARVVVVTSFTVKEYHRFLVVADAARASLPLLVRAAAKEYAPKLIPILLVLGSISTPGARATVNAIARRLGLDASDFWRREVEERSPLGRAMEARELVDVIAFLARAPEYMAGGVVYLEGASASHTP